MSEWPKPHTLSAELSAVDPFEPDMLPSALRAVAEDIADRMQVPLDFPAVAVVLSLAGAVNRRARVQPKQSDTTWQVVPNLWGGIIAPPGFMKTPLIGEASRPLAQIEERWQQEYRQEMDEYLAIATREEQQGGEARARPIRRRLIVNDATHEKLHEIMRDNPAGVLVIRDELTGWIAELESAGREGQRSFYLSAWDGNTGHTVDRIKRGTVHVPACCLSMIGGIQPNLLRKHMGESGAALQDDGMLPRFQLLVWPDLDPEYRYIDRAPNTKARSRLEHLYSTLTMLDESDPIKLRFRNDAQDHFQWWFEGLENRIRSGDLPLDLASHLGKYRSLMPTLAALFELASCGFDGFEGTKGTKRVSLENALRAVTWCGYLESHARRIYSLRPSPEEKAATDLIAKIKSGMVGSDRFFTSRDVAQCGWKGLNGPEQVHKATEVLVKTGWIREATLPVSPKGGRPSQRFEINPRIWNEL